MPPTPGEFAFHIGHAGWVRIDDELLPGPLYLRIRFDAGRPLVSEFYLDAGDREIVQADLTEVVLGRYVAAVFQVKERREVFERQSNYPGPQLSILASYFASHPNTRGRRDWVAESFRAQIEGSGVEQPRPPRLDRRKAATPKPPRPPRDPAGDSLTDAFLTEVADYYRWCLATRQRPAPTLAAAMGLEPKRVRTVHSWIAEARRRGILPPTSPGKAG